MLLPSVPTQAKERHDPRRRRSGRSVVGRWSCPAAVVLCRSFLTPRPHRGLTLQLADAHVLVRREFAQQETAGEEQGETDREHDGVARGVGQPRGLEPLRTNGEESYFTETSRLLGGGTAEGSRLHGMGGRGPHLAGYGGEHRVDGASSSRQRAAKLISITEMEVRHARNERVRRARKHTPLLAFFPLMVEVTLLFFAAAREAAGVSSIRLAVSAKSSSSESVTTEDLRACIIQTYPALEATLTGS